MTIIISSKHNNPFLQSTEYLQKNVERDVTFKESTVTKAAFLNEWSGGKTIQIIPK